MLDPRIYRAGLVVTALALVVLAFSLRNQQGALSPTIAPDAFSGQNVVATMGKLAQRYPRRAPGSQADSDVAGRVASTLRANQFASVTTDRFTGRTAQGTTELENVIGIDPGVQSGSIVVLAARDGSGAAGLGNLSATATLMELARDLSGETLHRTIVLASTTASQGTAGALRLASTLAGPIDGVIVLGDLAAGRIHGPVVLPWASRRVVAPPVLRNTVGAALSAQTTLSAGSTGLGGQFAHLAFPFTLGQQAPFGARGIPAVTISLTGEGSPGAGEADSRPAAALLDPDAVSAQLNGIGRAVLEAISALDSGPTLPAPSSYLLLDGKVIPGWAVSLLVLALLAPVALTTIDGLARAKRRGHVMWRSVVLVLAAALPFLAALVVVLAARLLGVLTAAPPAPVLPGTVPLQTGDVATMIVAALAMAGAAAGVFALVRRMPPVQRTRRRAVERSSDGAAVGMLLVMCVITLAIWLSNPFAALLLVPALHTWLWAIDRDLRLPAVGRLALVAVGVAPVALVVLYYANGLGYGPLQAVWAAVLVLAGHAVSLLAALEWSVVLGCLVSAVTLSLLGVRSSTAEPAPVTVRGPVTYAGPGSLGGTESALRR